MGIKLIEKNLDKYKSKLDIELKKFLKQTFSYKIIWSNYSVTPKKEFENYMFEFYRNDSIFYRSIKFKKIELYFFGLSDCVCDSMYPQFDQIPITLSFSHNIKSSAIVFGELNDKICLLIKVKFDKKLTDIERISLEAKYEIHEINDQKYINFGFIDNFPEIIDNISFFLKKVVVSHKIYFFLNIRSFSTYDFLKDNPQILKGSSLDETNNKNQSEGLRCKFCGVDVETTYDYNPKFTNFAGRKRNICANCYAKILVAYFKNRIGDKFINKSYLISSSNQKELIRFYIGLAEKIGVIDRSSEIEFNDSLIGFRKYTKEIPNKIKIKSLYEGRKGISERITIIDKETLENGKLSNQFKKLLYAFDLSDESGWEIRRNLIAEAKSFDLNKTHKHVRQRINQMILSKYSKKKVFNIFEFENKLNTLTLDLNGELNDFFKEKLVNNNLTEISGMIVINIVKNEIKNNLLINTAQIESRINELIENNPGTNSEKFYFIYGNSYYLDAIVGNLELKGIFNMFEELSCDIEYIIIQQHLNHLSKLKIEFKKDSEGNDVQNILKRYGFIKIEGGLNG